MTSRMIEETLGEKQGEDDESCGGKARSDGRG